MLRRHNAIKFLAMFFILLFGFAQTGFGAVSSSRWQNDMYVTEVEGSIHAFTATLYKVVDNSVSQSNIEKIDASSVVTPVYSIRKDVGTNFATADQAINAVKNKVFGDLQIQQILANVGGYAIQNKVKIIHIVFVYDCKINKRPKSVILFFNYKVSDNPKQFTHILTPPPTSGYLIADPSPVWIRISYTSRVLDSGLQSLKTYSKIYNSLNKAGILGRLTIDEMNLNGSVAKVLVNTQIKDNRFEMPQSGTYIPEEYVTKIIDAYKNTIQKDDPLYIVVNYVSNPTIAVDKNGNAKLSMQVIKKEIDGKAISSGRWYVMASREAFGACMNNPCYYVQCNVGACMWFAACTIGWGSGSSRFTNIYGIKKYNPPVSGSQICAMYPNSPTCAKYECDDAITYVCKKVKNKIDRENCYAFYSNKKVIYEIAHATDKYQYHFVIAKIGGSAGNGSSKLTATKFTTTYYISYGLGGSYATYLVSEPLTKIPLGGGAYYHAMQKIAEGLITYNSNVGGVGGYRITKTASIYIPNATKAQLESRFKYDVVDPFKTNKIIDVRHDTVNGLSAKNYPGWNTPITYVFR